MGHIETTRLMDFAADDALLNRSELDHLGTCEECRQMFQTFTRQNAMIKEPDPEIPKFKKPA